LAITGSEQFGVREAVQDRVESLVLVSMAIVGLVVGTSASFGDGGSGRTWLGLVMMFSSFGLAWLKSASSPNFSLALELVIALLVVLAARLLASVGSYAMLALPVVLGAVLDSPRRGYALAGLSSCGLVLAHVGFGALSGADLAAQLLLVWLFAVVLGIALTWVDGRLTWAWAGYSASQSELREAREQRLVAKETQADLALANLQLARLSDRLALMTQLAEEARQTKEDFLASVSHELRTPLNMIIGFTELVTRSPEIYDEHIPGSLLSDILVIERNAQHLSDLVDDILDLSTAEAGRLALNLEWVNLVDVASEAALAVRPLVEAKDLYLDICIQEGLPSAHVDRVRLRQVILNLLSNAGRATVKGGITLELSSDGRDLICAIRDTGPGIAVEDRERIFEPFAQAGDSLRRRQGTGLGLSISSRLIEMHQGRMFLESEVGVGSKFSFSLPLTPQSELPRARATRWFSPYHEYKPRDSVSRAPMPAAPQGFLLLDPERELGRRSAHYLADADIRYVDSIDDARQRLIDDPAQALLINDDVVERALEDLDLASLPLDTPIAICWIPGDQEAARRLGIRQYLTKPVHRAALEGLLAELEDIETILVVDDDREANRLLTRMIQSIDAGIKVIRASNGLRALALLRQRQPDIMLLDMVMPEMDGYRVIRELARDERISDIPVVAISGQDPTLGLNRGNAVTIVRPAGLDMGDVLTCLQATGSDRRD